MCAQECKQHDQLDLASLVFKKTALDPHDEQTISVLQDACVAPNPSLVRVLLEEGADPNQGLHYAIQEFDDYDQLASFRKVAEVLLQHLADPTDPLLLFHTIKGNFYDDSDEIRDTILSLLLEHKADPNVTYTNGDTPLVQAAYANETGMVTCLLEHGADPNQARRKDGYTPLLCASMGPAVCEIVHQLLRYKADVQQADESGKVTPLVIASADGCTDVVRLLLGSGACCKKQFNKFSNPLFYASQNGHVEVVQMLLKADVPNQQRLSKFAEYDYESEDEAAEENGHTLVVSLLRKYGNY